MASGVGAGVGEGGGVAEGFGVGVLATGIEGIAIVRTPDEGVLVGWVGSSSVMVWHPARKQVPSTTPQAVLVIVIPSV